MEYAALALVCGSSSAWPRLANSGCALLPMLICQSPYDGPFAGASVRSPISLGLPLLSASAMATAVARSGPEKPALAAYCKSDGIRSLKSPRAPRRRDGCIGLRIGGKLLDLRGRVGRAAAGAKHAQKTFHGERFLFGDGKAAV